LTFSSKYTALLVFIILCLIFSGCSLIKAHEQADLIESIGKITGRVEVVGSQQGPVIVLRFRDDNGHPVLISHMPTSEQGDYLFDVAPGKYYIAAFVDFNGDEHYQKDEHGNFWGTPSIIEVPEKKTVNIEPVIISGPMPKPDSELKVRKRIFKIVENIGSITTITDPTFTSENYSMGMWHPVDFLEQVGGGLFFLHPYQAGKIPVLFIHGANGGPTVWQSVIESLDSEKFQPWIFYYPSGLRLDMISGYLLQAVASLHNKYNFNQLSVASHSMGGLVTRSFIKKCQEQHPMIAKKINFVMTVNSPMGGMSSAATGVNHSPIIVPAWIDVAPESAFLKDLHEWMWPDEIPYHLVFSFKTGDSSDGTVSLESQIPLRLQDESVRMYGFNNDHAGTLKDPDFISLFNELLNNRL
jgi:pimeloyl-ACP methyl ester carboxylesterase/uncharacterized protein (DUF2141 family)